MPDLTTPQLFSVSITSRLPNMGPSRQTFRRLAGHHHAIPRQAPDVVVVLAFHPLSPWRRPRTPGQRAVLASPAFHVVRRKWLSGNCPSGRLSMDTPAALQNKKAAHTARSWDASDRASAPEDRPDQLPFGIGEFEVSLHEPPVIGGRYGRQNSRFSVPGKLTNPAVHFGFGAPGFGLPAPGFIIPPKSLILLMFLLPTDGMDQADCRARRSRRLSSSGRG